MTKPRLSVAVVFAACMLTVSTLHAVTSDELKAQGAVPLNDQSLLKITQGNTLDHKMVGTRLVAPIYYGANGMRTVDATAFGGRVSQTKWWIENGRRCEINVRTHEPQCGLVFKTEQAYTLCIEGEDQCKWTFLVREGNPNRLQE